MMNVAEHRFAEHRYLLFLIILSILPAIIFAQSLGGAADVTGTASQEYTFAIISDMHIGQHNSSIPSDPTGLFFKNALDAVQSYPYTVDFIVSTGDMVYTDPVDPNENNPNAWDILKSKITLNTPPILPVIGNHDYDKFNESKPLSKDFLTDKIVQQSVYPASYAFTHKNAMFVVLPIWKRGGCVNQYLSQKNWILTNVIPAFKANPNLKHFFIFSHFPLASPNLAKHKDALASLNCSLDDDDTILGDNSPVADDFIGLLKSNGINPVFFGGHTHLFFMANYQNTAFVNTGTTSQQVQFANGGCTQEKTMLFVKVKNDTIEVIPKSGDAFKGESPLCVLDPALQNTAGLTPFSYKAAEKTTSASTKCFIDSECTAPNLCIGRYNQKMQYTEDGTSVNWSDSIQGTCGARLFEGADCYDFGNCAADLECIGVRLTTVDETGLASGFQTGTCQPKLKDGFPCYTLFDCENYCIGQHFDNGVNVAGKCQSVLSTKCYDNGECTQGNCDNAKFDFETKSNMLTDCVTSEPAEQKKYGCTGEEDMGNQCYEDKPHLFCVPVESGNYDCQDQRFFEIRRNSCTNLANSEAFSLNPSDAINAIQFTKDLGNSNFSLKAGSTATDDVSVQVVDDLKECEYVLDTSANLLQASPTSKVSFIPKLNEGIYLNLRQYIYDKSGNPGFKPNPGKLLKNILQIMPTTMLDGSKEIGFRLIDNTKTIVFPTASFAKDKTISVYGNADTFSITESEVPNWLVKIDFELNTACKNQHGLGSGEDDFEFALKRIEFSDAYFHDLYMKPIAESLSSATNGLEPCSFGDGAIESAPAAQVAGDCAKPADYTGYPAIRIDHANSDPVTITSAKFNFEQVLLTADTDLDVKSDTIFCDSKSIVLDNAETITLSLLKDAEDLNLLFEVSFNSTADANSLNLIIYADAIPTLKNKPININLNNAICGTGTATYIDYLKTEDLKSCASVVAVTKAGVVKYVPNNYVTSPGEDLLVLGLSLFNFSSDPYLYIHPIDLAGLYALLGGTQAPVAVAEAEAIPTSGVVLILKGESKNFPDGLNVADAVSNAWKDNVPANSYKTKSHWASEMAESSSRISKYESEIQKNAPKLVDQKKGLDVIVKNNPADLLKAIIEKESNFYANAQKNESCGLMQVNVEYNHSNWGTVGEKAEGAKCLYYPTAACKYCKENPDVSGKCVKGKLTEDYIKSDWCNTIADAAQKISCSESVDKKVAGYTPNTYCLPWLNWSNYKNNLKVGTEQLVVKLRYVSGITYAEKSIPAGCKEVADKQIAGLMEGVTVGEALGILGYRCGEHAVDNCAYNDAKKTVTVDVSCDKEHYVVDVLVLKHLFAGKTPGPIPPVPIPVSKECATCNSVLQCLACVDESAYDQLFYMMVRGAAAVTIPQVTAEVKEADYKCKGSKNRIALLGDSITMGYAPELKKLAQENNCNFTFSEGQAEGTKCEAASCFTDSYTYCCGKWSSWMSEKIAKVIDNYDQIVVMGGTNDVSALTDETTVASIQNNLSKIYALAKSKGKRVIAVSITPWKSHVISILNVNSWIKQQKSEGKIDEYVDLAKVSGFDYGTSTTAALHPTSQYDDIAKAIFDTAFKAS